MVAPSPAAVPTGAANGDRDGSLLPLLFVLTGALAGGRLGSSLAQHRSRFLAIAILVKLGLVGAALVVAIAAADAGGELVGYGLIVLLALAMGLQNATARILAVPDLTTTVLTLTLTGLAADSTLAGGTNPRAGRRALSVTAMLLGAAVGAFLVFHAGVAAVLTLTFTLLGLSAIAAYRLWSRSAA